MMVVVMVMIMVVVIMMMIMMMVVTVVLQAQHEQSKLYFTYATECLTQALNLALANKHTVSGCQTLSLTIRACMHMSY